MFVKYSHPDDQVRKRQSLPKFQPPNTSWGPSHSFSSDSQDDSPTKIMLNKSQLTSTTEASTPSNESPTSPQEEQQQAQASFLKQVWNSPPARTLFCEKDTSTTTLNEQDSEDNIKELKSFAGCFTGETFCNVCFSSFALTTKDDTKLESPTPNSETTKIIPPSNTSTPIPNETSPESDVVSTSSTLDTPLDERRLKAKRRLLRLGALAGKGEDVMERPIQSLELVEQDAYDLNKSISELTMRSSHEKETAPESRLMAYYAVGRNHRQTGRGGNRRCYFTGKVILGGTPFYAGSVQQGLRTLVVFCLPSSLGLPKEPKRSSSGERKRGLPESTRSLTSMDDMSLSVDEELDPNWNLKIEYLLSVLPRPSQELLLEMKACFPVQYETLPEIVRSSKCWGLYVKFCSFSGLPIAEGELHYKVKEVLARQYGEDIILCHEVVKAANGRSAETLSMPNQKTFSYLRKYYTQQSERLPKDVFLRSSWKAVTPAK